MVIKLGAIGISSVNISFSYLYEEYDATDQFVVTLYNETTSSVVATLLSLNSNADTTCLATITLLFRVIVTVCVFNIRGTDCSRSFSR